MEQMGPWRWWNSNLALEVELFPCASRPGSRPVHNHCSFPHISQLSSNFAERWFTCMVKMCWIGKIVGTRSTLDNLHTQLKYNNFKIGTDSERNISGSKKRKVVFSSRYSVVSMFRQLQSMVLLSCIPPNNAQRSSPLYIYGFANDNNIIWFMF